MRLRFTKMHGLGNDFVVFDAVSQDVELSRKQLIGIADRHFGIGCDQILLVEPPRDASTDFYYRIFNADGGEVAQCGNGVRCLARFVADKKMTGKAEISVATASGVMVAKLEENGLVTVNMGAPQFEPRKIPFIAGGIETTYRLEVGGETIEISALSIGNPHAVQVVADVESAALGTQGALIEAHARFPQKVNAGFMQILNRSSIKLRVYERGSGETLACGSGACAAVVAGIRLGLLANQVLVQTRGGELTILWKGDAHAVMMTGPAITVFEGEINL